MKKNNKTNPDEEIVAVIAAAIASMRHTTGCNLVVRSIRRVNQSAPVWNMTGRVENLRKL